MIVTDSNNGRLLDNMGNRKSMLPHSQRRRLQLCLLTRGSWTDCSFADTGANVTQGC
jgi:hypothetical protein